MAKESNNLTFSHILVALDASPASRAALDAAANLALQLQSKLTGLFIEDINLLKLAQLPFAQEIRYPEATAQKLDSVTMERAMQNMAALARSELKQSAEQRELTWSFRVARGVVVSELLLAAVEADILVLGRMSRCLNRGKPLGSTARSALARTSNPILLTGPDLDLRQPILLIYDGSNTACTALHVALSLAGISQLLYIFLVVSDEETAAAYQAEISQQLPERGVNIHFHRLEKLAHLDEVLRQLTVGFIIIGESKTPFIQQLLQLFYEEIDFPLLVIR